MLQRPKPTSYNGNFAAGRSRKRDAPWRGAEATTQWAFQSAPLRPMTDEHRNPRRCEPIDVGTANQ